MRKLLKTGQVNNKKEERFCGGNYFMVPLLLLIAVLPLIVRVYVFDSGYSEYAWFTDQSDQLDFFLRYKAVILCIIALIMVVLLGVMLVRNHTLFSGAYWVIPAVNRKVQLTDKAEKKE